MGRSSGTHWALHMLGIKVNYWGKILLSQAFSSPLNMMGPKSSGPRTVKTAPKFVNVLPDMDLPMKASTGWDFSVEAVMNSPSSPPGRQ